ncbi:WRKY domain [Sesbania bispinosa]|nr:WRKY domain [Sesbania bispinosa]
MCNIFGPIMNNYQGDLTDIIRASYGSFNTGTEAAPFFCVSSDPMNFSSVLEEDPSCSFGDPFSNMRDPFLHELDMLPNASAYFNSTSGGLMKEAACFGGVLSQKNILEDDMRRPCNSIIMSNMTQISPNSKLPISPADSKPSTGKMNIIAKTSKDHCFVDNTGVVQQISTPRNPGLKRRKILAKKSICIPAPAAPNSRQSGEVVPSDLWAWRKYGQKPIKGSLYPRSYYRCSSSKGCPARKQVERSRTDPNMLVITYSSEHNHPWPTQRNALAGTARSQSSKNNIVAASKNSSETTQPQNGTTKPDEEQQESNSDSNASPVVAGNPVNSTASVKGEIGMDDGEFSNIMDLSLTNHLI